MVRLAPYFPKSHGKPRVDDRRVLSIFLNRNVPLGDDGVALGNNDITSACNISRSESSAR